MLDDRILLWKLRCGSKKALGQIYQKYLDDLLTIAANLLGDAHAAEDVVQEVFISFGKSAATFRLKGSLKNYLAVCVANRARDIYRTKQRRKTVGLNDAEYLPAAQAGPLESAIHHEQRQRLSRVLVEVPYEQREVIILHLQGGMKFREIAAAQQVSIKTVQSRYRYGLEKIKSLLNSEVCNATIG